MNKGYVCIREMSRKVVHAAYEETGQFFCMREPVGQVKKVSDYLNYQMINCKNCRLVRVS